MLAWTVNGSRLVFEKGGIFWQGLQKMPLDAKTFMEIILHFVNYLWRNVTLTHFNFNSPKTGKDLLKVYYEMTFHMPVITKIFHVILLVFK